MLDPRSRFPIALVVAAASVLAACERSAPARAPTPAEEKAATAARLVEEGRIFHEAGDYVRAQEYYASAIKAGAEEKMVLPLLLRACVANRNYRLGAEYAEAALARDPSNARLRLLTGTLHASVGDTVRSREHLERAATELEREPEVQFTVAVFFRDDAKDIVMADKYFRRYLALAPNGEHAEEAKSSLMEQIQ